MQTHSGHRRLAERLRVELSAGRWKRHEFLPSQVELAKSFGVSIDTLRAALRLLRMEGKIAVTPRRRLRVLENSLETSTHGTILEVSTQPLHVRIKGAATLEIQHGIEEAVGRRGVSLIIVHDYCLNSALPSAFLDWPLRGIVVNGLVRDTTLRAYQRLSTPVILVDFPTSLRRLGCVCVDNVPAARALTERVIQAGHRRIAFLRRISFTRKDIDPDSKERQAGYEQALRAAGLRPQARSVFTVFHTESHESASIQAVAGPDSPFTAAVAADTTIASFLLKAARAAGRRVPEDLSIVCFQHLSPEPEFSGMATDFRTMGSRAIHAVFEPVEAARKVRLAPKWVDRGTLAPAPP